MDVNSTLTCPICRKLSYFVIPSVLWYFSKEEKDETVDSFMAKLKSDYVETVKTAHWEYSTRPGAMSVQNKNPLQVGLLLFLFLNLIGKYAWQGDCQQVGVHHAGIFYEFVPWNGFVEWEIAPCGYWKISADNGSYLVGCNS
ncbi:uncharacterized protein LOC110692426 [Chenopodium quinoa]|uniref:uncharacterized protein LOC110692426 n=1 Tax=Chenopodium quinoa TaxID=63459 RepID=UPI000B79195F|nr:uncharacterized protein LOC110692426 [Chenopodium quinoa]XP_021725113.1 uncharacterized protein LOC110692426 [Chenopodium quinoa]